MLILMMIIPIVILINLINRKVILRASSVTLNSIKKVKVIFDNKLNRNQLRITQ